MPSKSDIEHLLRRTEYVARAPRVNELKVLPTIGDAVDNILSAPANPPSLTFTETENWQRGEELTHFWFNRMAHDSPRPIQEKMSFFWHGHFCSEFNKVGSALLMQEQIDTFRAGALGNLRTLALEMSTQVAMLRYLDNNQNQRSSPNQNFARELMELFLLGVGNYTEADVEAATAAWTGHTDQWDTGQYVWRPEWHDGSEKRFLGRTINTGANPKQHGFDTINVILGNGKVPSRASVVANRGRATREVAAEFLSKKLWIEFAGTEPPAAVISAMRTAAINADFDIKPWLRAMLTHDAFYTTAVKQGRVRTPVEFVVATLVALGMRSEEAAPLWLMQGMGQRPFFPPNVSGWKHNGYWVNASAMSKRTDVARNMAWRSMAGYWSGDDLIHLAGGNITRTEVIDGYGERPIELLDRFLELMRISLTTSSHQALGALSTKMTRWERNGLISLILLAPDFHVA